METSANRNRTTILKYRPHFGKKSVRHMHTVPRLRRQHQPPAALIKRADMERYWTEVEEFRADLPFLIDLYLYSPRQTIKNSFLCANAQQLAGMGSFAGRPRIDHVLLFMACYALRGRRRRRTSGQFLLQGHLLCGRSSPLQHGVNSDRALLSATALCCVASLCTAD